MASISFSFPGYSVMERYGQGEVKPHEIDAPKHGETRGKNTALGLCGTRKQQLDCDLDEKGTICHVVLCNGDGRAA